MNFGTEKHADCRGIENNTSLAENVWAPELLQIQKVGMPWLWEVSENY